MRYGDMINKPRVLIVFYDSEAYTKLTVPSNIAELLVKDDIDVYKVDSNLNKELMDALGITILPTGLYYKAGQLKTKFEGKDILTVSSLIKNQK